MKGINIFSNTKIVHSLVSRESAFINVQDILLPPKPETPWWLALSLNNEQQWRRADV